MSYDSIAWLPLCAGLTVLGLVLSYFAGRRRGRLALMRGAAWSLLPIAIYLTGTPLMFWRIGEAIAHYADGFVFSPLKWAGLGVLALAVVLFAATGGRERRRAARLARSEARRAAPGKTAAETAPLSVPSQAEPKPTKPLPVRRSQQAAKSGGDDDMGDIEDILRKRGL